MTVLDREIEKYLHVRRSMGQKLEITEFYLKSYSAFAKSTGVKYITRESAIEWVTSSNRCQKEQYGKRYSALKMFSDFWSQYEPRVKPLPDGLFKYPAKRRTPYIFSHTEITDLLLAADKVYEGETYRKFLYRTIFGLVAVTGMRHGEVLNLKFDNINFDKNILSVEDSKNRYRDLPIKESTAKQLQVFFNVRNQIKKDFAPEYIFVFENGTKVSQWASLKNFRKLLSQANINGRDRKPDLLDLRHSFAVNTLIDWYQSDEGVNTKLIYLSAYMGHEGIKSTYWYLSNVPELASLAAGRLERYKEAC